MKVLVTGSMGTLGRKLCAELRARGNAVLGADLRHGAGAEMRTDVAEARQVERTFSYFKPEVCYHLAGEFGRVNGHEFSEQLWRANCVGTYNVIQSCLAHNTRLIFASSSEAYGDLGDKMELREHVLTTHVPHFFNEYALTKWTNEKQIQIACDMGLRATILRFFNVYGPGEHFTDYRSVICQFIWKALKGLPITIYTSTSRSFLYVDDWAHAVANVCDTPTLAGEAFNIASPTVVTIDHLWALVAQAVGHTDSKLIRIDREVGNVSAKQPHITKAVEVFGLRESVSLPQGLGHTVKWMREQL